MIGVSEHTINKELSHIDICSRMCHKIGVHKFDERTTRALYLSLCLMHAALKR